MDIPTYLRMSLPHDHSGNPQSHFVNAASWGRLVDRLIDFICAKRISAGFSDQWALVLIDCAPQHILTGVVAQKALDNQVLFKVLPEGQTHVWQPCDMFAIATIKRKVDKMWDDEKEILWACLPTNEAVQQACLYSAPVLKRRMHGFFSRAVEEVTPNVIALCWDASSLSTALFQQPPRVITALWDLGCSLPTLVNLHAQEEACASARSTMFQALQPSDCICLQTLARGNQC